ANNPSVIETSPWRRSTRTAAALAPQPDLTYVDRKAGSAPPLHLRGDGHCHPDRRLRFVPADAQGHIPSDRDSGGQRDLDLQRVERGGIREADYGLFGVLALSQ